MPGLIGRLRTRVANAIAPNDPSASLSTVVQPMTPGTRPMPGALPEQQSFTDLLRYQFQYGQNVLISPRGTQRNPFSLLRQLAEFSHIRSCIEARKDQMTSLRLEVRALDKKQSTAATKKADEIRKFFLKPDKRRAWNTWLRMLIEEVLVIDALSIYRRKTFGGDLFSLDLIDGSTILPLIDERGDTPEAPNVAYRQIIYGHPIEGGDCTVDQLMYRPRTVRTHTPYGLSPVEWVLMAINSVINRDIYNLAWFTEGDIPDSIVDAPATWSADQIRDFETFINLKLGGKLGARRRMKVMQNGMAKSFKQLKEPDFSAEYDEWLLKVICAAFAVPPSELGFTQDAGSRNTAKQQENVVYRRGVKPLSNFICAIGTEVIHNDLREPDFELILTGGEPEDILTQARVDQTYVNMGKVSIDELRQRDGQEMIGMGPFVMTPQGPVFTEELLNPEVDDDPLTTDPKPGDPLEQAAAGGGDPSSKQPLEEEIKKYRTVALKSVKAGKQVRPFRSAIIPEELGVEIHKMLGFCSTKEDVGALFHTVLTNVEKSHNHVHKRAQLEERIRKIAVKHFRKQGKALEDHLNA